MMKKHAFHFAWLRVCGVLCAAVLYVCSVQAPAGAAGIVVPDPTEKLAMPEPVAGAVEALLQAALSGGPVEQAQLDTVLDFCAEHAMGTGSRVLPSRPEGEGVFYYRPMPVSLTDLMSYTLNPKAPGAALYPNSVRRSVWKGGSLLKTWQEFSAELPPQVAITAHGQEYEQITPDETSGSYYGYTLKRLFALAPVNSGKAGNAALFMVSVQDGESEKGLKGAIIGDDNEWNYVYTGVPGSTLPMVGWAETHIYSTATITLWVEPEPGASYVYVLKWLKAGWNGMNVVKTSHINTGITRYLSGMEKVLGSAKRPSVKELTARAAELASMSDADQIAALDGYSRELEQLAKKHSVTGGDFDKVLKDGSYGSHLTREERESELIKLFVKAKLGMPVPDGVTGDAPDGEASE